MNLAHSFSPESINLLRESRTWVLVALLTTLNSCSTLPTSEIDSNLLESIRWYTGESGTVDDEEAMRLLERAAADNDALSIMWLARVYSTGRMGYTEDKPHAQNLAASVITDVEAMAISGINEAQFLMGTAYAEELGKSRNDGLAADWYRRAAENGHVLASHNMGNIYFSGAGVPQDNKTAVAWWTKAAAAGDAIPQFRLGEMYEQGLGVEANLDRAISWYQDSASRGNNNAKNALARIAQ